MPGSVLLLLSLAYATCFAANATPIEDFLPDTCRYLASFEQSRTLPGLPVALESSGRVLFDCERGMIWRTEMPFAESLVYTSLNRHFRITGKDVATEVKGVVQGRIASVITALMGGDGSYLKEQFSVSTEKTGQIRQMVLVPLQQTARQYLQQIIVNRGESLVSISLTHQQDSSTQITISGMQPFTEFQFGICESSLIPSDGACEALFSPLAFAQNLGER